MRYLIPLLALALTLWTGWTLDSQYRRLEALRQGLAERQAAQAPLVARPTRPFLPPERHHEVYTWLVQQAVARGLRVSELRPTEEGLFLELRGGFPQILEYLDLLSQAPFALGIRQYSLVPRTPRAEELSLQLRLSLAAP